MDRAAIAAAVKAQIDKSGLPVAEVARRANGMSRKTVERVIAGEKVSDQTLYSLSTALGWEHDTLHRIGAGEPAPPTVPERVTMLEHRMEELVRVLEQIRDARRR